MSTVSPDEMHDMSCEECEGMLPLVADGVLTAEDDPALFRHLARCPDCQRSVVSHDLIELALTQLPSPESASSILRAQPARPALRFPDLRRYSGFAVAAAAIVAFGLLIPDDFGAGIASDLSADVASPDTSVAQVETHSVSESVVTDALQPVPAGPVLAAESAPALASADPAAQAPAVNVLAVSRDADGNLVTIVERDGELIELHAIDGGVGQRTAAAGLMPVSQRSR